MESQNRFMQAGVATTGPLWPLPIAMMLLLNCCSINLPAQDALDAISRQATQLEAELGKYNDNTPDAADVMVKLVDLYHGDGRVFGLVRIGNRFVSTHPTDRRHQDVMLKMIDGLQAMSRNKDMIVACRQFLTRYPKSPQCSDVEIRLADTLAMEADKEAAAEAFHAIWNRHKNSPTGRRAAVRAIERYTSSGNDQIAIGAELAEQVLNATAGSFARNIGIRSMDSWSRINKWAESNRVAATLLQKKLIKDPERVRAIHMQMGDNYSRLAQHTNSARSYNEARKIRDDQAAHLKLIEQLDYSKAKSRDIATIAKSYAQNHPDRDDRFRGLSALAQAYLREDNPGAATSLLGKVLAFDARGGDAARVFVEQNAKDESGYSETEKVLLDAIKANEKHAAYLRYTLAFNLYRDRIKDEEKTRSTLRKLIEQSPTDDGYSRGAIDWLLNTAADENAFKAELKRIVDARSKHPELTQFARFLSDWRQSARRNPKLKTNVKLVDAELTRAGNDPVMSLAAKQSFGYSKQEAQIRDKLLSDNIVGKLSNQYVDRLLEAQGYYYRHYVSGNQRHQSATFYGKLAKRKADDYAAAQRWLEAATDYASPEIAKEAAEHLLRLKPTDSHPDIWRRLMVAADKNKDAGFAKKAHAWIQAAEKQFGAKADHASFRGDVLHKLELVQDANSLWQQYLTTDPNHYESRECASRLIRDMPEAEQLRFLGQLFKNDTPYQGRYATWLADVHLKANQSDEFAKVIAESHRRYLERPLESWDLDIYRVWNWVNEYRRNTEASEEQKRKVFAAIKSMDYGAPSAAASLALMELGGDEASSKIERILTHQRATVMVDTNWNSWDGIFPFAQAAITRREYIEAATIAAGLLANNRNIDDRRQKSARDIVTQCYARLGSVGLTIDEDSPIAPLLQAALYLRLGDEKLALASYDENRALFDQHRNSLPVDLISFVCRQRIAAGGDSNHDYVEDVLRSWMVANSESAQIDEESKAEIQLLIAKNYFKARRFDVARGEFTTTINRYPESKQAIEARFGIGESFMSQKVFDQAELVFEELARSTEMDIVVRAEFLRGVLAFRRGDRDDAREIFRSVLERVPDVSLANQALFNLSEVYGSEERYIDQLNLLRTVGRLGRRSKRLHAPGTPLSIVVHDSDLGISRGHNKIPVIVTTKPGGDSEKIMLTSTGAGRGLFRFDLNTKLGDPQPNDNVLQLLGGDTIQCDYPDQFKTEFKKVPLSDVEITIAASADFQAASSKIEDKEEETFSERMAREAREEQAGADLRVSQQRPENQIKPGNDVYMRVVDPDRDLSSERDTVPIKLVADSGDTVQIMLQESGPHTGIFEGSTQTAELPAGALASDTAIDHNPLMAIDLDQKTYWLAEPDGATPKTLTIDMKDLREASRVRLTTPDPAVNTPLRVDLLGSNDGEFWFRLAGSPEREKAPPAAKEFARMTQRIYNGRYDTFTKWYQVADLGTNRNPDLTSEPNELSYVVEDDESDNAKRPCAVIWSGKLVQPRAGAARITVNGIVTALALDGLLELPVKRGSQSVDLWLSQGTHDLTMFAATDRATRGMEATIARADLESDRVALVPFTANDFDLSSPLAKDPVVPQSDEAGVELKVGDAQLNKKSEQFGAQQNAETPLLNHWATVEDSAQWKINVDKPGAYEVWMNCSHPGDGSRFVIEVDDSKVAAEVPDTRDWNRFQESRVATLLFQQPGERTLKIVPTEISAGGLMDLKGITLRPATGAAVIVSQQNWDFRFPPQELRYVRIVVNEYLGESVAISNVEIGGKTAEQTYIPTEKDVLSLSNNDVLEIAAGDTVTATYTDEFTQNETGSSQLLTARLTATYNNAEVMPIVYEFTRSGNGQVAERRLDLKRIDAGERLIVEIRDYDEDRSKDRDTIDFEVFVNDGDPMKLTATETEEYSGIFTKEVDTTNKTESGKLTIRPGDRVYIRYLDTQNTFPGHSVPRESVVYVNEPSNGEMRILQSRARPRDGDVIRAPIIDVTRAPEEQTESLVALNAPLTIEVIDPDRAKNSGSTVKVAVIASNGSALIVECEISGAFADRRGNNDPNWALEQGRFIGQVILQLGGKNSPELVPKSPSMPTGLIGRVLSAEKGADEEIQSNLVARVLNLTGKDVLTAAYNDAARPTGKAEKLKANGRLVADGALMISDREYKEPVESLHVGEKIYFSLSDPDQDTTDERDLVSIQVTTEFGERETLTLGETMAHSGVFTGSFLLAASEAPTPDNVDEARPQIECYFGDKITAKYIDPASESQLETLQVIAEVPVVIGTDGLVSAFTKTFNDETLAVETKFRIAESYFELFKSHKELERDDEKNLDLESGRRVLREVMEDYPDPKYAPRVAYLLGQFAQELEQWDEAIRSYELIIQRYPDHTLAADARYKLAQSYEEAGDFDEALEAYVTLAATHPKSPLIASVMIRISDYFYKREEFEVASQVGEKFGERFEGHEHAAEMAFRVGQCFYKMEDYRKAGLSFDDFAKVFPDDELASDSLFWSGEAYRLANNNREAFRRYNRCRWDYPESEAAKYARGRLALPEMLQQFEAEANSVDNE